VLKLSPIVSAFISVAAASDPTGAPNAGDSGDAVLARNDFPHEPVDGTAPATRPMPAIAT
jgi:hypothetical protein